MLTAQPSCSLLAGWGELQCPSSPGFTAFLRDFGNDADSEGIIDLLMNCDDLKAALSLPMGSAAYPTADNSTLGDPPVSHVDLPLGFSPAAAHPAAPLASTSLQQVPPRGLYAAATYSAAAGPGQQQPTGDFGGCSGAPVVSANVFTPQPDTRQLQRAATAPLLPPAAIATDMQLESKYSIRAGQSLRLPKLLPQAAMNAAAPGVPSYPLPSSTAMTAAPDNFTAAAWVEPESPFVAAVATAAVGCNPAATPCAGGSGPAGAAVTAVTAGASWEPEFRAEACRGAFSGPSFTGLGRSSSSPAAAAAHAPRAGSEPAPAMLHRSSSSGAGPLAAHTSSSSSDASVDVGEQLLECSQRFLASVSLSLSLYSANGSGVVAGKGPAGLAAGLASRVSKGGSQRGGAAGRKRKGQRELPKQQRELEELRQQVVKMSSEQEAVLSKLGELESFQGNLQTWLVDLHAAWQNAAAANQSFRGGALHAPHRCF